MQATRSVLRVLIVERSVEIERDVIGALESLELIAPVAHAQGVDRAYTMVDRTTSEPSMLDFDLPGDKRRAALLDLCVRRLPQTPVTTPWNSPGMRRERCLRLAARRRTLTRRRSPNGRARGSSRSPSGGRVQGMAMSERGRLLPRGAP